MRCEMLPRQFMVSTARSMLLPSLCHLCQDINLVINYDPPQADAVEQWTCWYMLNHVDTCWQDLTCLFRIGFTLHGSGIARNFVSTCCTWDSARTCFGQSRMAKTTSIASAGLAVQGARARPSPFCEKVGHLDTLEHTLREVIIINFRRILAQTHQIIICIPACMQRVSMLMFCSNHRVGDASSR